MDGMAAQKRGPPNEVLIDSCGTSRGVWGNGSWFTIRGWTAKRPRPRPRYEIGVKVGVPHSILNRCKVVSYRMILFRLGWKADQCGPRWTKVDLSDPAERLWMTLVHVRGDPFRVHGSWFTVRDSPTRMTGRGAARGTNAERKKIFLYRALNTWIYLRYLRLFKGNGTWSSGVMEGWGWGKGSWFGPP